VNEPRDRRHPPITHALPPEVRHAVTPGGQDRNQPQNPDSEKKVSLRLRRCKCFNCGETKKVWRPLDEVWTGVFCDNCGRRLTVTSAPLPREK